MKHSFFKTNYKKNCRMPKTLNRYVWWLISKYSDTKFIQRHELELIGIPLIIYGLEYHYKNFYKIQQKAQKNLLDFENSYQSENLLYPPTLVNLYPKAFQEVGAYLNVLGRIEKIITSHWIEEYFTQQEVFSMVPSILSMMPLRNKYFAHRSFDDPRSNENLILKPNKVVLSEKRRGELAYAIQTHLSLGLMGTWMSINHEKPHLSYEIKIDVKDRHFILKKYLKNPKNDIEYFKNDAETGFIQFTPSKHHPQIMLEIKKFFEELFKKNCLGL